MKRLAMALAMVAVMLCGCAKQVEVLPVYIPGREPPSPLQLPQGTTFETPDGNRYKLGANAVVIDQNHWIGMIQLMQHALQRIQDLEQSRSRGSGFNADELEGEGWDF